MNSMQELLIDRVRLPSPPAIAVRILEVVKKEDLSFRELAAIIQADPALTARVLKVANSSFYSLASKVSSIEKALPVLGVNALKNIALSFVISSALKGDGDGGFDFNSFWKRSVTAAVAADLIGSLVKLRNDDTFIAALLQDIGIIIMYLSRSNDYLKVIDDKRLTGLPVEALEKQYFGFDHPELGSELLKTWGLPGTIYMPIRFHHQHEGIPEEYRIPAQILFLSDRISSLYHGTQSAQKVVDLKRIFRERFGVHDMEVSSLIDAVADRSIEILSVFELDPGNLRPFSQVLQEANEELSSLNFSYEMLVVELKQAKEKAEQLAQELRAANEILRKLAFRDSLTGLLNHRSFQELLEQELSRAHRYNRQLSLIMFDIDHFKKINDTYGHPRGDLVLKAISDTVKGGSRDCDVVARYGGEEFALILPETDLNGAVILAERCRKTIEEMEIPGESQPIKTTISVGVTTYLPEMKDIGKAAVIEAADRALYNSKKNGRNKISVVRLNKS